MKVALLSDIHANYKALKIVLDDLNKEEVNSIIVAGDIVGYYYWPHKVIDLIMSDRRFHCIQGNHDRMLKKALDDQNFFIKYRKRYGAAYDICKEKLQDKHLDWLFSLPQKLSLNLGNKSFYITHSSLSNDDNDYIYPDSKLEKLLLNYSDKNYTILGHTHYPFVHNQGDKYLINPGSVGQPRDSAAIASYVILNIDTGVIQFKRKLFSADSIIEEAEKLDPNLPYLQNILRRK